MCKKLSLLKFYAKFSKVLSINLILLTEFVTPKYLKKQKDLKMFQNDIFLFNTVFKQINR